MIDENKIDEKKYNTKIKKYSDDNYNITFCNRRIFKPKTKSKFKPKNKSNSSHDFDEVQVQKNEPHEKNIFKSCKRARERLFDIIYLNSWDYFITLTFDPQKVDSYSVAEVMSIVRKYFYKIRHIYNSFRYIIVPEYHKSGRIHIHALVTDCIALELVTSKVSQEIYNISSWKWGWSTARPIYGDNNIKLSLYVTKYITKDNHKIFGKYYWSSKGLIREVETIYLNNDYSEVDLSEYSVPQSDIKLKYLSHFDI